MGMQHHAGAIWPDAVGTPTNPTQVYTATGPGFFVTEEGELACSVVVTGAPCRAVGLIAEATTDGNVSWREVARATVLGCAIGTHQVALSLPRHSRARILARVWGVDPDIAVVVWADSRVALGRRTLDGQPLELAPHQVDGVECFGDGAGAAVVMAIGPDAHVPEPQAAADQQWLPTGEADTLVVDMTVDTNIPVSVELMVRERPVGSVVEVEQPAVNTVVAGVVAQQIAQEQLVFGALDTRRSREIAVRPGMEILVLAQYTGAAGAPNGIGVARLYALGRG